MKTPADTQPSPPAAASGGKRAGGGGTYGYFVPTESAAHDPSRGAELERNAMAPDADFAQRPEGAGPAISADAGEGASPQATRERRIREAAYERYRQRAAGGGDAVGDWLAAEADIDAEAAPAPPPPQRDG